MRVLLVDDHKLLLEGLTNLLHAHGIEVVGAARDGWEAVAAARKLRPDVILMDIAMPNCDGLSATRLIRAEWQEARIVILTTSSEDRNLFEAIKSGACGYLLKSMDAEELVTALEQAQRGAPPFSAGLAAKVLAEFARIAEGAAPEPVAAGGPAKLSARQREVLTLVAQGLSYKEAGAQLGLSARTVKYHMSEIITALHLENRAQVLAYAGRAGMGRQSDA